MLTASKVQSSKNTDKHQHKFRILHVTPFFPPDRGGIANHLMNLCKTLGSDRNELQIVCPQRMFSSTSNVFDAGFGRIVRLPSFYFPGWPYPTLRSLSFPIDLGKRLDQIISSGKFDVVHVHGHHYPLSWMAINSAFKHKVASVLTLHGMYALNPNVLGGESSLENLFNRLIFRRVLARATAVIGLTEQITNYAKTCALSTEATRYYTIGNGVNVAIYKQNIFRKKEFRKKYGLRDSGAVISFVGRFEQVKAVAEFVLAAKRLLDAGVKAEFLVVGGGSLESRVKQIAGNTEGIHIKPWQRPERIHELFIASDVFANPSRFEALPLTILEAMSAGLHIVYTPVGGVPDILKNYSTKTLMPESTTDSIASTLTHVLTDNAFDPEGNNSHPSVEEFDWTKVANETVRVYEQITRK